MASKTVVCPECGDVLPHGRLSCPACGTLVASVAGAPDRSRPAAAASDDAPTEAPAAEPVAPVVARPARPRRGRKAGGPEVTLAAATEDASRELPDTAAPSADPEPDVVASAPATSPVPPILRDWASGAQSVAAGLYAERWDDESHADEAGEATEAGEAADTMISRFDADADPDPLAGPVPRFAPAHDAVAAESRPAPAGAWLPPSGVFATTARPVPAGLATAGTVAVASSAPAPLPSESPAPRAGDVSLLADLPFDAPDTLPGWLVAVGAGISVVSFLLPWSAVVLGSGSLNQGWTDTWGVASPSHLVVLLAALALLALATLPSRVPGWIRTGLAPLVLGGVLLGLLWPYLFGGYGARFGALAEAVGALLLVAGGILALRPTRHGGEDRAV